MADIYPVDPQFAAKARIDKTSYEQQYQASVTDPDGFWGKAAERLQWMRKPTKIKNVSYDLSDFHIKWFEDGELNASVNCLDRQLETRGDSEIPSAVIGELVMEGLRQLDSVAYIRFASVYREFSEASDFEQFASTVRDVAAE